MIRCAIYSRKSVFREQGDSVQNQIEMCEMYIKRNFAEEVDIQIFEDDGWSAKSLNRPQFKRMMSQIESGKIDKLVCYKLDRLSRNVADFSSVLDILQKNNCDFVSVSEQFDTSNPIGRAMIYIASIFAQLERESIAERVRDNMIEYAKKGRFSGGTPPTGFKINRVKYINEDMKEKEYSILIPDQEELEKIHLIYNEYLKHMSVSRTVRILDENRIRSKNGNIIGASGLIDILRNPVYVKSNKEVHEYLKNKGMQVYGNPNGNGYLIYNKMAQNYKKKDISEWICAISKNKGVIEPKLWLEVQKVLDKNQDKKPRIGTGEKHDLLSGLLKCSKCGSNMIAKENGGPYKKSYYICGKKKFKAAACSCKNVRVDRLDKMVLENIHIYSKEILKLSVEGFLKENSVNKPINNIKSKLEQDLKEKEDKVNGLVNKIALIDDEEILSLFMQKIKTTNAEIQELKIKLEDLDIQNKENKMNEYKIKEFMEDVKNFENNIDFMETIRQKREAIARLVKEIIWDGDNFEAKVIFNVELEEPESKKK